MSRHSDDAFVDYGLNMGLGPVKKPAVLGLDPGLEGGMALIAMDGEVLQVAAWPTVKLAKSGGGEKNEYDEEAMYALIDHARAMSPAMHALLEKQHAMKGQGTTSMFSTGNGYGLLRGLLVGMRVKREFVSAKSWQKVLLAGTPRVEGKKASSNAHLVCSRLWPGLSLLASERSRTPHSGICDALLIAEYGRRALLGRS